MDHLLKSVVWERIRAHESETFTQIRGGEFSYLVRGDALKLDRTGLVCSALTHRRGIRSCAAGEHGPGAAPVWAFVHLRRLDGSTHQAGRLVIGPFGLEYVKSHG